MGVGARLVIQPARLLSRRTHLVPSKLRVSELLFEVPLNHANPQGQSIKLFARSVRPHDTPIVPRSSKAEAEEERKPWMVYLEGGPGFGNREPQDHPLTRMALDRGYQLLFLDYRGTGLSTPINTCALTSLGSARQQVDYLKHFRADNIVRDAEAVRLCLTEGWPEERTTWSLFGQSFGGFVALTYLSKHPSGLREVFITGGLAPIAQTPDEVYTALYQRVLERNQAYYKKFPEDVQNVLQVASLLEGHGQDGLPLPGGGKLTVQRFLSLGIAFGMHGGLDTVHALVLRMLSDHDQFGFFTRSTLMAVEAQSSFDTNPIYALLHEPIYFHSRVATSLWAAFNVGRSMKEFGWLTDPMSSIAAAKDNGTPLYFSGEMVYPFHFDTHPELAEVKDVTNLLASDETWGDETLYDMQQLRENKVPVYAASFVNDMYVDFQFARQTAKSVANCKVFETNIMYHNALRSKTDEVLKQLFELRDDSID